MRLMDFTPLTRSSIGFDRLFDMIENATQGDPADGYPPYDIEKTGEDAYRITLAVAGFEADELALTWQPNQLIVAGRKSQGGAGDFLYQGIAGRAFQRSFSLADYVRVTHARLHNGMLAIELAREVPEAAKPRRIQIGTTAQQPVEGRKAA